MAGIPLALAVPAAVSTAAYLNAKLGISQDITTIKNSLALEKLQQSKAKVDRLNVFYRLEELALDRTSANDLFLLLPQDSVSPGQQREWTFAEAYDTVLKFAAWLSKEHGVKQEEVVAMDFTNKPEFVWIWFALWSLGAKAAFINSNLRDKALVHSLRVSTARLLLVDPNVCDAFTDATRAELAPDAAGRAIDPIILEPSTVNQILQLDPYRAPNSVRSGLQPSTTALLIYTSGTTGLPKAANVPWSKAYAGIHAFPRAMNLTKADRYYSAMPLYHSSASLLCCLACLGEGCTYVMGAKFSPRHFMRQIAETKSTAFQYIGEMCRYLLSSPPSPYDKNHNLRVVIGNGLRPDVWQPFRNRFNIPLIVEFYGATEGPGATAVKSRNEFTTGSIGYTGALVRLLSKSKTALLRFDHDLDTPWRSPQTGFCARCSTGEAGEMVNALDASAIGEKFSGYFGNEKATNGKVLRDVFVKGDAWYRTGDLIKEDREGRVWFVDRIGDTFRWKGENVSTAEVSEALGTHPSIREANVYGVSLPGHDGRAGCAAVITKDGTTLDEATRASLAQHVKKRLPRFAVPLFLRIVKGDFEVTGTQKQQKVALRNEGVEPGKMGGDEVVWLSDLGSAEGYRTFGEKEWLQLVGGKVKL